MDKSQWERTNPAGENPPRIRAEFHQGGWTYTRDSHAKGSGYGRAVLLVLLVLLLLGLVLMIPNGVERILTVAMGIVISYPYKGRIQEIRYTGRKEPDEDCERCKGTGEVIGSASPEYNLPALRCTCTLTGFHMVDVTPDEASTITIELED
jgi:hypothetical protein